MCLGWVGTGGAVSLEDDNVTSYKLRIRRSRAESHVVGIATGQSLEQVKLQDSKVRASCVVCSVTS